MAMKRIAKELNVSPSSVHLWTRDIELTAEQRRQIYYGADGPLNPGRIAARNRAWSEWNRDRRRGYQQEGRRRVMAGDPLHIAGCMLYWAEGAKDRNTMTLANSDVELMKLFVRFLREVMTISDDRIALRLNFYSSNGLTIDEVERFWLEALALPRSALQKHTIDHLPTSSSGRRGNKLPFGVATVRVKASTHLVQHIYGALQEYGRFDRTDWLD